MDRVTPPNYRVPSTPQPTDDRHTETEEGGRVALSLGGARVWMIGAVCLCTWCVECALSRLPTPTILLAPQTPETRVTTPTRPQPTKPDISCIALASQSQPGPQRNGLTK